MQPINDPQPIALNDVFGVMRRRWLTIFLVTLVVTALVVGTGQFLQSRTSNEYASTVQLAGTVDPNTGSADLSQLAVVIEFGDIGRDVRRRVGGHADVEIEAEVEGEVGILTLVATGADPERTAEVASAYAEVVLATQTETDRAELQRRIEGANTAIETAQTNLTAAQAAAAAEPDDETLQAELNSARSAYQSAIDTLRVLENEGAPDPEITLLASQTTEEVQPSGFVGLPTAAHLAIGIAFGVLIGIGVAYLRDALDRRLSSAAAAAEAFRLPVIAEVPNGGRKFAKADGLAPPGSLITEAYRRLRTIVQLERDTSTQKADGYVILVASARPSEGKSTTVAHLARSLAEVGNRVLCVSADFRRPKLHRLLGVPAEQGIASLGHLDRVPDDPNELIQPTPVPGVSLIAAGHGSSNPTELLAAASRLIAVARDHYDYIIVDSSPVLSANDTLDLVQSADAVVAVCRYKQTTRAEAERTRESLAQAGAHLLGVTFTGVKANEGSGYYYGYYMPMQDDEVLT